MSIRIVVCDDSEMVRVGLRSLLEAVPGFEVVAETGDAEGVVGAVEALRPDVVVMDVRLPSRSGIEACRDIRSSHPETRVLMLTAFADEVALFSSILAGASGYVLKQVRGTDLVDSIRLTAAGQALLGAQVAERMLAITCGDRAIPFSRLQALPAQQRRVLDGVTEGLTNRQIAARLGITEKTVKNHVSGLLATLGLARRTQAAAFVTRVCDTSRGAAAVL